MTAMPSCYGQRDCRADQVRVVSRMTCAPVGSDSHLIQAPMSAHPSVIVEVFLFIDVYG
jgi:hypothetical protein